jgi:hypothetical protein
MESTDGVISSFLFLLSLLNNQSLILLNVDFSGTKSTGSIAEVVSLLIVSLFA